MATENGARALGVAHRFGTLSLGKQSDFIYLDAGVSARDQVLEKAVCYGTC
jgi:cytosine/adenosine deaminase-related metal-dependent hydrolase